MKPAPFKYFAPTSVEEALSHLAQYGYDAKVLAGGQSLIPAMNFRLAQPAVLVDLNRVSELFYINPDQVRGLRIGAMTRESQVEHDPVTPSLGGELRSSSRSGRRRDIPVFPHIADHSP